MTTAILFGSTTSLGKTLEVPEITDVINQRSHYSLTVYYEFSWEAVNRSLVFPILLNRSISYLILSWKRQAMKSYRVYNQ